MNRSVYQATGQAEDTSGIAKRVANISVSAIKQMPVLASKVPGCISLGQGIPFLNTPEFIREAVREALLNDPTLGQYSLQPGKPELKAEVAKRLQRTAKTGRINPETEIVITCGAMEGLAAAISSIIERGDEVIIPSPNYSSHIEQVLFAEGKPVFVPLIEDAGWKLDTDKIKSTISKKTKAIILCSPMNPTGSVFGEAELREVAKIAIDNNLYIIADEAYDFLTYDDETHFSLASLPELKDNLIATYSFSKMFCMTGWRIGYLYSSARIVSQVLKVHDAFAICAPTISQYAALVGLQNMNGKDGKGDESVNELVATLARRRDLICTRLDKLTNLFTYQKPQGAYYVFPSIVPGITSTDLSLKLLYEAKVITIPGDGFGPTGAGHIRLSFGGTDESITEGMDRIEKWAAKNL